MRKALKELYEKAPLQPVGNFSCLMFMSNGAHDGIYGKNGYDNLLIFGFDDDLERWVKVSEYGDVLYIDDIGQNICQVEIASEYGIPAIWFTTPFYIDHSAGLSTVIGSLKG